MLISFQICFIECWKSGYPISKFIPPTPIINDELHPNISGLFLSIVRESQTRIEKEIFFSDNEICIKGVICDLVKNLSYVWKWSHDTFNYFPFKIMAPAVLTRKQ
jgi:hypothetical protein